MSQASFAVEDTGKLNSVPDVKLWQDSMAPAEDYTVSHTFKIVTGHVVKVVSVYDLANFLVYPSWS